MARYILDFEDTNYPYQAVIKTAADSLYIGQIPLSASLVGFSAGQAGSSAQVTILPMGGFGSTDIKFSEYDWANCVPAPSDFSTNAKIMAYLTTYFTGQAIAPTPVTPTMSVQTIYSQPFTLDLAVDGLYCASPVGTPMIAARESVVVPAGYTVASIAFFAKGNNDTAIPFSIYAFDPDDVETIIISDAIPVNAEGIFTYSAPTEIALPADWRIGIEYSVPLGRGTVSISGSAILVVYEVK
jgi:hypothetical protein